MSESLMKYTKKGIHIFSNQTFNLLVLQSVLFPKKLLSACKAKNFKNHFGFSKKQRSGPGKEFRSSILNLIWFGSVHACNFKRHFFSHLEILLTQAIKYV